VPFGLEHGELLTEGEDFEGSVAASAEEDADDGEDGADECQHALPCNMAKGGPVDPPAPDRKLLIPRHHRVLATHT